MSSSTIENKSKKLTPKSGKHSMKQDIIDKHVGIIPTQRLPALPKEDFTAANNSVEQLDKQIREQNPVDRRNVMHINENSGLLQWPRNMIHQVEGDDQPDIWEFVRGLEKKIDERLENVNKRVDQIYDMLRLNLAIAQQ